jgi:hypothetical protein
MPQRLADLVGRVMTDPEFVTDLQRSPDAVLAAFDLTDDERRAVRDALRRLAGTPAPQHAAALRTALLRRVAT